MNEEDKNLMPDENKELDNTAEFDYSEAQEANKSFDQFEQIDDEEGSEKKKNVALVVLCTLLFITLAVACAYGFFSLMGSKNQQQASSVVEEITNPEATETPETEKLTLYQENSAIQALESAVDDVYGRGNYTKPKYSDYTIEGDLEKGVTVSGYIVYEGNSQKIEGTMKYIESENDFELEKASINGKAVDLVKSELEAQKKTEVIPTPSASVEANKATTNNSADSTEVEASAETIDGADNTKSSIVASYSATIGSSVTATIYMGNNGVAKAYAISESGKKTLIAIQSGSGTTTKTVNLETGNYTIELEATSGADYNWNYSIG